MFQLSYTLNPGQQRVYLLVAYNHGELPQLFDLLKSFTSRVALLYIYYELFSSSWFLFLWCLCSRWCNLQLRMHWSQTSVRPSMENLSVISQQTPKLMYVSICGGGVTIYFIIFLYSSFLFCLSSFSSSYFFLSFFKSKINNHATTIK